MNATAALDWGLIDTVLLDMDGTLLDLRYDNWFWRELVPHHYARRHGLDLREAQAALKPRFEAVHGTMEWYCIDYWSETLGLDIAAIKRTSLTEIGFLPGAEAFLERLERSGKRRVLVTNAHPTTFALKSEQAGLGRWFDACYSTHPFRMPKEQREFWPRFAAVEQFTPERTLFVDDSLPVLDAAHAFGIAWLRAIRRPDSSRPVQEVGRYGGIDRVADLM
ncbi:MAG TPA: GMP/IMP nucleotidase [Steroidobacteraceae bacterium]|nr:GMP/IMP nucleotidase [Steroidobacteraceae bacterium]